ncbi:MAG: ribonuclease HII [Gordonibacter sp.]|uniref:ribonuclease HII n=1 Tax=Gordonibacter sp. TaxID=1968902 RepID=UPI002FCBB232
MGTTVAEIKLRLQEAGMQEFAVLERSLVADVRKGVRDAVEVARRRLEAEQAERQRLASLYAYERTLAAGRGSGVVVGLDEVGRGPLAGPLAVGAVVLPLDAPIEGLNDSKQVKPEMREYIAERVKQVAVAWTVEYIEASDIDAAGMTASLVMAFRRAVAHIEQAGVVPDVILLDGNPLRLDAREVNVVKGDARCASIAAASIVAKVERDALMCRYAQQYPEYGFDSCKGYASAAHIDAIKRFGLTPIHRASFCTSFMQPSLF